MYSLSSAFPRLEVVNVNGDNFQNAIACLGPRIACVTKLRVVGGLEASIALLCFHNLTSLSFSGMFCADAFVWLQSLAN